MHAGILLFVIPACLCALPPGNEEELYCPRDMCIKLKYPPNRLGWTGPRSMLYECCNQPGGATQRPRGWGYNLDPGYRSELISEGWHTASCDEQDGVCGGRAMNATARLSLKRFKSKFDPLAGRVYELM